MVMNRNKITLKLSEEQRNLLLKHREDLNNEDLVSIFSIGLKRDDFYEFHLTQGHLEELYSQLYVLMDNETNRRTQGEMMALCNYLEDYMPDFEDEFSNQYSEYSKNTGKVYVFKVALENAKKIWRNIAIRGGQTLHDFHDIIYDAFDRDDEHLYSFHFPTIPSKSRTRKVMRTTKEYTHPYALEGSPVFDEEKSNAAMTSIESLKLNEKQKFYYLFDFGDSWWHEIIVEKVDGSADEGKYPRIIERRGESPPQYVYEDEEE